MAAVVAAVQGKPQIQMSAAQVALAAAVMVPLQAHRPEALAQPILVVAAAAVDICCRTAATAAQAVPVS